MSSLGFISLEELWGDNYNEKTGIDYTGGNNFETSVLPISNNNENLMLNDMQPDVKPDVKPEMQTDENKNILEILNKINERIIKLENFCIKKENKIIEGFSNKQINYFDLLILIGLGILIIYVLDSIMKFSKK
jgi:hypothetical protein